MEWQQENLFWFDQMMTGDIFFGLETVSVDVVIVTLHSDFSRTRLSHSQKKITELRLDQL